MKRATGGFSLIELIVVMAVVGILFAVMIVNVRSEIVSNQIRSATSQIVRDIENTRSAALRKSKDSNLTLTNSGAGYQLTTEWDSTGAAVVRSFVIPDGVKMAFMISGSPVTTGSINYSAPYGDSSAASRTISISKTDGTTQTFYLVGVTGKVIRQ